MRALRQYLLVPVRLISAIGPSDAVSIVAHPGQAGGTAQLFLTGNASLPGGAWVLSTQLINAAGHPVASAVLPASATESVQVCAGPAGPGPAGPAGSARSCFEQLASHGYRQLVTYQPASRFWAFQWYETAIFLLLAAGLAGFCFWYIRRRIS
jgi:hypothetical protein